MAQFDVHRNPGRNRTAIPYLVVVQGNRWENRPDRVVVPLVAAHEVDYRDRTLNPEFLIEGTPVILNPLQIVAIPARFLGPVVASFDHEHTRIIAAIDLLIQQGR
ncbi:CcdB family protein [Azospirillum sp. RWY-5-1]|uniref:Toxin CcdB n=1 Tax=Azospirillum oleiclasticum TaxID=2735135 RepID=A0ABX2TLR6_9PROT|nr:CcdB family protein [Azospirillum oleiclasticum]NYZ17373.1 CcdB family protein [Azospirillum oleiclasticum]NYZ24685.1 CcdB family protein [Azospirillum oleiclasticum]